MIGGAAAVAIVFLVARHADGLGAELLDAADRPRPRPDGQDHEHAGHEGHRLRAPEQRHGARRRVRQDRPGAGRARHGGPARQPQPGFSLFDKQQLGSSNFQQQITYQRALEGQLAQTIESIQGVSSAQVQLVLPNPQDQLFSDSTQPSTAAVLLSGSTSLDPSSVRGIAQLVASSVPGPAVGKVTITDSTGSCCGRRRRRRRRRHRRCSPSRLPRPSYDAAMAAQVDAMLTQTLGPGKAAGPGQRRPQRQPGDARTRSSTRKKGVPLTQQTQNESLNGRRRHRRRSRHDRRTSPPTPRPARRRRARSTRTRPPTRPSASTRPSRTR